MEATIPDNPYLLLTPGPLSTSKGVRAAMMQDLCTWDEDYKSLVRNTRAAVTKLATAVPGYTTIFMQGSGTFCVESVVCSALTRKDKLLVLANGAYGNRMGTIAKGLGISVIVSDTGETAAPDPVQVEETLTQNPDITHVGIVHVETSTGMLNPAKKIGRIVKAHGKTYIVDAMSSFGGIPMDINDLHADFMVTSANKCIQGVPGFGVIIAKTAAVRETKGNSPSLSLDLYEQWREMEESGGKWRFTSPTHAMRAFARALSELEAEGGIPARFSRYTENHRILTAGMEAAGFPCLLPPSLQSPIITAFISPKSPDWRFDRFYETLKDAGFVIYPGKVTQVDTFRIANIGHVFPADIHRLTAAVQKAAGI